MCESLQHAVNYRPNSWCGTLSMQALRFAGVNITQIIQLGIYSSRPEKRTIKLGKKARIGQLTLQDVEAEELSEMIRILTVSESSLPARYRLTLIRRHSF